MKWDNVKWPNVTSLSAKWPSVKLFRMKRLMTECRMTKSRNTNFQLRLNVKHLLLASQCHRSDVTDVRLPVAYATKKCRNLTLQTFKFELVLLHSVVTDYYILSKSLSLLSHFSVFEASQEPSPNELWGSPRAQFPVFPKEFQRKKILMLLRLIKGAA